MGISLPYVICAGLDILVLPWHQPKVHLNHIDQDGVFCVVVCSIVHRWHHRFAKLPLKRNTVDLFFFKKILQFSWCPPPPSVNANNWSGTSPLHDFVPVLNHALVLGRIFLIGCRNHRKVHCEWNKRFKSHSPPCRRSLTGSTIYLLLLLFFKALKAWANIIGFVV